MSMHSTHGPNPLSNLSLTDPQCKNDSCTAFQAAHNASQATVSYTLQFEYGHWVTWYYSLIIFIFSILHLSRLYTMRSPKLQRSRLSILIQFRTKSAAAARYLTYRRFSGRIFNSFGLPSAGILALLSLSILFLTILTFAVRPYYRGHRGYGSPPLAIRTGLMATACIPLILLLSGKANFVTLLTGVGHERLNVLHRWVGWVCLSLSVAHTVPFLVAPVRDGGYTALREAFYEPGGFEYTGVPPLAMLTGIVIFSIPYIRARFYELFYFLHILLYIAFFGLCFWHFGQLGDSWNYLWATLAIWLASVLARVFWYNRTFNVQGQWMIASPTDASESAGEMTRLDVATPPGLRWRPGQHFFLRMPGLDGLGNHPFTVASAFRESHDGYVEKLGEKSHQRLMTFYVRRQSGFTKRLATFARDASRTQSVAWLDGPYGGLAYAVENEFDNVILVAGGGGVTACLPWLEHLAFKRSAKSKMQTTTVKFVWMVRYAEHLAWADDSLRTVRSVLGEDDGFVETSFHVTGGGADSITHRDDVEAGGTQTLSRTKKSDLKIVDGEHKQSNLLSTHEFGRPRMEHILPALIPKNGQTLVIGCGPESLKIDISNACAQMQLRTLRGEISNVALHTETFGW